MKASDAIVSLGCTPLIWTGFPCAAWRLGREPHTVFGLHQTNNS